MCFALVLAYSDEKETDSLFSITDYKIFQDTALDFGDTLVLYGH